MKKYHWPVYILIGLTIVFVMPPLLVSGIVTLNILPTCSNGAIAPNGNLAQCGLVAGVNGQLVNPNSVSSQINQYFYCSPSQISSGYVIQINNGQTTCVPPNQINVYSNSNIASSQSQQQSVSQSISQNQPIPTKQTVYCTNIAGGLVAPNNDVSQCPQQIYCPNNTPATGNDLQNCPPSNSNVQQINNVQTQMSNNNQPPLLPTKGYGQLQVNLPTSLSLIPYFFNATPLSTIPLTTQNTWIQATFFSMNTNDYHGQFTLPDPKTTNGISTDGDELILIPLNLDIGIQNNYNWFQFSIRNDYHANTNSYSQYGDMEIWQANQCVNVNPNSPRGGAGVSDYLTSSATSYTSPLQLSIGHSYHFDFYADQTKPNYMVFLLVDDTNGGINSGSFWWNEWQVPAIGLVYDPTCSSPALFFEAHIASNEVKISGFPQTQFNINAGFGGNTLYAESGLKPLPTGIISKIQSTGNGNFVWQVSSPSSTLSQLQIPLSNTTNQTTSTTNVFVNWMSNVTTLFINFFLSLFGKH